MMSPDASVVANLAHIGVAPVEPDAPVVEPDAPFIALDALDVEPDVPVKEKPHDESATRDVANSRVQIAYV